MEELDLTCPYCWEQITFYLERDIGDEKITIVEDCRVCCRPIEISYSISDGEIRQCDYHGIEGT